MSNEVEFVEIWRKEVSNYLLIEYEKKPRVLPCRIVYLPDDDYQFSFGGWGIDRETITEEMIYSCCQYAVSIDCNISISSFYANYEFVRSEMEEEEC